MKFRIKLSNREWTLAAVTGFALLFVPFLNVYLLPAYDAFNAGRALKFAQQSEYAKLRSLLSLREEVDGRFAAIAGETNQKESDSITMSSFLRYIETRARYSTMTLINMKPQPVRDESGYKIYAVRMSLSARLFDVLRFVSEVTQGEMVTAIDTFTIRGVQGGHLVECTLSVWMVRLPLTQVSNSRRRAPEVSTTQVTYGN